MTMPPKSSQPRLSFMPLVAEERALSPTNSDVLSMLQSSQFEGIEGIEDPIQRSQSAPLGMLEIVVANQR